MTNGRLRAMDRDELGVMQFIDCAAVGIHRPTLRMYMYDPCPTSHGIGLALALLGCVGGMGSVSGSLTLLAL